MSLCLWQNTESVMLHSFPTAMRGTENTSVAQTIKNYHVNVDISYLSENDNIKLRREILRGHLENYTLSRDNSVTYTFYNLKHTDLNTQ